MASRMFLRMYSAQTPMQRSAALLKALEWPESRIDKLYVNYTRIGGHFEQSDVADFSIDPLHEAMNLLTDGTPVQLTITSRDLIFRMEFIPDARPESLSVAWTNRGFAELGRERQERFMELLATIFQKCGATCGLFADESVEYMEDYVTVDGNRILVDPHYGDGLPLHIHRIWVKNSSDIEFIRGQEDFSAIVRISEEIIELSKPAA